MIVKCITNNISHLPKKFQRFAFTQDENGVLDISIGAHYVVYGRELRKGAWFYLVHTDSMNVAGYWWMPASLYEVVDETEPSGWQEIVKGLFSYPCYGRWEISEGLEDGDGDAIAEFNAAVSKDSTFPTKEEINR